MPESPEGGLRAGPWSLRQVRRDLYMASPRSRTSYDVDRSETLMNPSEVSWMDHGRRIITGQGEHGVLLSQDAAGPHRVRIRLDEEWRGDTTDDAGIRECYAQEIRWE